MEKVQENIDKKRNYTKLSYEQKQKIYKIDQYKFTKKAIASYYKIHVESVTNVINEMREQNKMQKLTDHDAIECLAGKGSKKVVDKVIEAKAELMTIESKYKSQKIATQNILHDAMTCDIEKARVLMQKATSMAMDSLSRAVGELDHSNAMSVMSVATAYEKMISAQQKHMTTLMKVGERYGIVDETPRSALIDQSTTLTQNSMQKAVTINLIQHQPSSKRIIPSDVIDADVSSV